MLALVKHAKAPEGADEEPTTETHAARHQDLAGIHWGVVPDVAVLQDSLVLALGETQLTPMSADACVRSEQASYYRCDLPHCLVDVVRWSSGASWRA